MPNVSLKLLVIKTHSLEALREFYKMLGFDLIEEQHGKGPVHFSASLNNSSSILELYPLSKDLPVDTSTRLGFEIEDPDSVVEVVESLGGKVVNAARQTKWGYLAIVKDPDGRTIELYRQEQKTVV